MQRKINVLSTTHCLGITNLSFGFLRQEIQCFSGKIFALGGEGKGGPPSLPRRKSKKIPENIEYPTDKPKTQVTILLPLKKCESASVGQPLNLRPACTTPQRRCVFGDPDAKLFKFSCNGLTPKTMRFRGPRRAFGGASLLQICGADFVKFPNFEPRWVYMFIDFI